MIVVKIELISAISRSRNRSLGMIEISNDGTSKNKTVGHYNIKVLNPEGRVLRRGRVEGHKRSEVSIFNLVRKAIEQAGYDK